MHGMDQNEDARLASVARVAVAEFMERYAERLVNGPAIKEFAFPINRNHYDSEVASAVRNAIYALAQAVRTGVDLPEADWPQSKHAGAIS